MMKVMEVKQLIEMAEDPETGHLVEKDHREYMEEYLYLGRFCRLNAYFGKLHLFLYGNKAIAVVGIKGHSLSYAGDKYELTVANKAATMEEILSDLEAFCYEMLTMLDRDRGGSDFDMHKDFVFINMKNSVDSEAPGHGVCVKSIKEAMTPFAKSIHDSLDVWDDVL